MVKLNITTHPVLLNTDTGIYHHPDKMNATLLHTVQFEANSKSKGSVICLYFICTGSGHQKYIFSIFSITPFFVHLIINQFDHRTHHQNAYIQQYNPILRTQNQRNSVAC
jgi:hypothetical protein